MTLDEFWLHIHATKQASARDHEKALVARLAKLDPDDIIDFDHWWWAMKSEAASELLWCAAYTIGGGCSDDGFSDFRSWLVLQGRDVFQAAVSDPDTLADLPLQGSCRCECYPGSSAWFQATGTARDRAGYDALRAAAQTRHPAKKAAPRKEEGRWDFDDAEEVRKRLPRLAKLYLDEE